MPPRYRRKKNTLIHGDWEEHKYIAKVKRPNGKYRYFYSNEEYQAYLKGQEEETKYGAAAIEIGPSELLSGLGAVFGGIIGLAVTKIAPTVIEAGREFVENVSNSIANAFEDHKYVKRITLSNGEYRYFYTEEEYQAYLYRQACQENEPDFMKNIKETDGAPTRYEDALAVNPEYDMNDIDYSMNCLDCTVTYDLRRRGYDVTADDVIGIDAASAWLDPRTDPNILYEYYEDPVVHETDIRTFDSRKNVELFKEELRSNSPAGSRGNFMVQWRNSNAGHSMAYEVDNDGDITVICSQTGTYYADKPDPNAPSNMKYESLETLLLYSVSDIVYCRTDNLKLRENILYAIEGPYSDTLDHDISIDDYRYR